MKSTLELYKNHSILYSSINRGITPLVDLKNFISTYIQNPNGLILHDKVIGKAAAVLIFKMGIKFVHTSLISKPALELLESQKIEVTYKKLVEAINDKIEPQIATLQDPEEIYRFLSGRRII